MSPALTAGRARLTASAALAAVLVAVTGCGGGPKIVPVSGTVTIDGHPLTYGHVQVLPDGYRPASGRIGPDGRFTLTTTISGDGCAVGTHTVVVLAGESLGPDTMKWHAPQRYADSKTSELTVTITEATDDLKIELKGDGGKPPPKVIKEGGSEFAK
jgi:hypothetical protein